MVKHARWARSLGMIVVSMFLLAGCSKASGGGWIPSATDGGKATFGFTFQCKDRKDGAQLFGQFEYHDTPSNVRVHGTSTKPVVGTCAELDSQEFANIAQFDGAYRPKPNGAGGTFVVTVIDAGEPGRLDDTFCVQLYGGLYDGYTSNCPPFGEGNIGGGNIQVRTSQ